jgi:hypothetical protein
MFGKTESSQITNRLKYSISLLLLPLPTAGYGSEEKPRINLGNFDSDPGLKEGDWIYIYNFPVRNVHHNIKAVVKERQARLTWQGDCDKSILESEILVETEDRDLLLVLTEEIDQKS